MNKTLTALKGVKVGHSTHLDKLTGCTVVIFDKPYPVAYKNYGGSPGTFNTDTLRNGRSGYYANGIFISGGSWFGLTSAGEILKEMARKKIGFKTAKIINPNLTGAIVFDLGTHIEQFNPDFAKEAVDNLSDDEVQSGNLGAGTGTSVGKFSYNTQGLMLGMKAGIGSARVDLGNGIIITAMSVVNALGNVVLPNNEILAGNRNDNEKTKFRTFEGTSKFLTGSRMNTTISIVGINVNLKTRENYERVAHLATQGQVRAINPVHTSLDGDSVFVFSTEEISDILTDLGKSIEKGGWELLPIDIIGQAAAKAVQKSIYDACKAAETIKFDGAFKGIVPSVKDYK